MPGFDNSVVYFEKGIDPRGVTPVANQMGVNGRLLIGSVADPYVICDTLTAGNGIDITNAPGSITISSQGILQEVRSSTSAVVTCNTVIPWDDSIPVNTEGDEVLTVTITPKSATSILKIEFNGTCGTVAQCHWAYSVALFQDDNVNALSASNIGWNTTGIQDGMISLNHYMTSGTTSATTFKIRVGPRLAGAGVDRPLYINGGDNGAGGLERKFGGVASTYLTVTEYKA